MINKLKGFLSDTFYSLSHKIEPDLTAEFRIRNINRLIITSVIAIPVVLAYILFFGNSLTSESSVDMTWRSHIFHAHIALAFFFIINGLTALYLKKQLYKNSVVYNLFFMGSMLGMLFAGATISAFDQYITTSITPFILAAIFISMTFIANPRNMFFLQVIGVAFFYLINSNYQPNQDIFTSNMVNAVFISGTSFILSFLFWNSFVMRETQKKIIQNQKEQLEEQLAIVRKSANELEIANKSKDLFLSIIAHDLRNPIGSMMSLLGLMNDGEFSKSFSKKQFDELMIELQKSATSTYNLLENLLCWANEQAQGNDYSPKGMEIKNIIDDVLSTVSMEITNKMITVDVNVASPEMKVFADSNMLKTILRNILGNAIKFSFMQSKIIISASENDQVTIIRVEDFGLGIPIKNRTQVFSIENNVSTLGTQNEKGTGLGLVLCFEFMKRHHGRISIIEKTSVGTLIELEFPKY